MYSIIVFNNKSNGYRPISGDETILFYHTSTETNPGWILMCPFLEIWFILILSSLTIKWAGTNGGNPGILMGSIRKLLLDFLKDLINSPPHNTAP